jgi:hypothetical protein
LTEWCRIKVNDVQRFHGISATRIEKRERVADLRASTTPAHPLRRRLRDTPEFDLFKLQKLHRACNFYSTERTEYVLIRSKLNSLSRLFNAIGT